MLTYLDYKQVTVPSKQFHLLCLLLHVGQIYIVIYNRSNDSLAMMELICPLHSVENHQSASECSNWKGGGARLEYGITQYQLQFGKDAPLMPQCKFEDARYMCVVAKHVTE